MGQAFWWLSDRVEMHLSGVVDEELRTSNREEIPKSPKPKQGAVPEQRLGEGQRTKDKELAYTPAFPLHSPLKTSTAGPVM